MNLHEDDWVVADIGAGCGFFPAHLSKAVGAAGRVFAVEIDPRAIDVLKRRAAGKGFGNAESEIRAAGFEIVERRDDFCPDVFRGDPHRMWLIVARRP